MSHTVGHRVESSHAARAARPTAPNTIRIVTDSDSAAPVESRLSHRSGSGGRPKRRVPALLGAGVAVAGITAIARVGGGVREILIARDFGTSAALETFLVAFGVATIAAVALGGAITAALAPTYFRSARMADRPSQLISSLFPAVVAVLVGAAVALAAGAPLIARVAGGGFEAPELSRLSWLIAIMAPAVVLSGAAVFLESLLNAQERFLLGTSPQVVNPVAAITTILLWPEPTAATLAVAVVVGMAAEFTLAAVLTLLTGSRFHRGLVEEAQKDRRTFFAMARPMTVALVFQASSTVTDQAVASYLPAGQVAVLAFGSRIPGFVLAVGVTAAGTVVLPQFSRLAANGDTTALRSSIRSKCALLFTAGVAVAAPIAIWSQQILALVFGRGEFTPSDVTAAAHVQSVAIWQLPFGLLAAVMLRLLSAQQQQRSILGVSVLGALANLGLSILGARMWGAAGIAGATAISFALVTVGYILTSRPQDSQPNVHDATPE